MRKMMRNLNDLPGMSDTFGGGSRMQPEQQTITK